MNAVNTVPLFILVWTFSAVCQDDKNSISVTCENVTGTVRKEETFTCRVSQTCDDRCILNYKFQYPEKFNNSAICKEVFTGNRCEQRNSFTCRYSPTTGITGQFRFFLQTQCGMKKAEFTVDIAGPSSRKEEDKNTKSKNAGPMNAVIPAVVGLSVILILILILMTVICRTQCFRFQKRMFPCIKHDDGHSPQDNENVI